MVPYILGHKSYLGHKFRVHFDPNVGAFVLTLGHKSFFFYVDLGVGTNSFHTLVSDCLLGMTKCKLTHVKQSQQQNN